VVLDKSSPGAGASGIACGVVRNNYFQPAMSELMQACVEVWESDPAAYHYNPVGYIALGAAVQEEDLVATYERQERIGYRSELILGAAEVDAHLKALFPAWRAQGVTPGQPDRIDVRTPSGEVIKDRPMWTYWNLQEGEIQVDPLVFATADGAAPPVIHLDSDAPLVTDDGKLITDELWGIYYKRDRHGVQ